MKNEKLGEINSRYWRTNLKVVGSLLIIWAIVSCLISIVLVEPLNQIKILGFPLGFWFAQQGSIISFIILIFIYGILMNKIDRSFENEISSFKAGNKQAESDSDMTRNDKGGQP